MFIAQTLGAMASAAVVAALFPGPLAVSTRLNGETSLVQGFFIEMLMTAQLVFTTIMLAAEKHKATFLAPVGIGLSLFIAELGGMSFVICSSLVPASDVLTRLSRCLLYRWISQSCEKLRPLCRQSLISSGALDLLDWSHRWRPPGRHVLPLPQKLSIRDR